LNSNDCNFLKKLSCWLLVGQGSKEKNGTHETNYSVAAQQEEEGTCAAECDQYK